MGSQGVFLYSFPTSRLTPQESILLENLHNGDYKLPDDFRVEVEDAFMVIINNLLLDTPVAHRYKIKLLRAVRNIIGGSSHETYVPFRRTDGTNKFYFMYGPNVHDVPTTLSDDLKNLVSTSLFSNPSKYFSIDRIEKVRILILNGELSNIAPFHIELMENILCNKVTEVQPLDLEKYEPHEIYRFDDFSGSIGPDEIQFWFEGDGNRTGGIKQDSIHTSDLFQVIGFNDTGRKFLGFKCEEADHWFISAIAEDGGIRPDSTGMMGSEREAYESSAGLAFVNANIDHGDNQLSVLRNLTNKLPTALPISAHVGILYHTPPQFQNLDGEYTVQVEDTMVQKFIGCQTSAFTSAGVPTCLGFTRFSNIFKEDVPISYTGSVCTGPADRFEFVSITHDTLKVVEKSGDSLKVFQLGAFDYKLMNKGHELLKHMDSGRDVVILLNMLYNLTREFDTTQIYGIFGNKNWNCLNIHKLSQACGDNCGIEIEHGNLPLETQRALKRWSPRNMEHNHNVIESSWLNIVSRVVYITIRDTNDQVTSRRLKMMCRAFGCPILFLGKLTSSVHDIIVSGMFHDVPTNITFRKTMLKKGSDERFKPVRWEAPKGIGASSVIGYKGDVKSILLTILQHPTVGCKKYLVFHMDRCGNGHIAQQQGVGPFDIPVSDYCIQILNLVPPVEQSTYWIELHDHLYDIFDDYNENGMDQGIPRNVFQYSWEYGLAIQVPDDNKIYSEPNIWGICSALGEQNVIAQIDAKAGVAWSITEALLNLCLSPMDALEHVIVTMTFGWPLVRNVKADVKDAISFAKDFCVKLGVSFEVDSCKQVRNTEKGSAGSRCIIACASCPCMLPARKITPALGMRGSHLLHFSLTNSITSIGSIYTEITDKNFGVQSLILSPQSLRKLVLFLIELKKEGVIISGHDISDGGMFACIAEMVIAGAKQVKITLPSDTKVEEFLCSQTPGIIIEVSPEHSKTVVSQAESIGVLCKVIGSVINGWSSGLEIVQGSTSLMKFSLKQLQTNWELYSNKQNLLFRNEGEENLDDSVYGNYEMILPIDAFYISALPDERHQVTVYLLPGCNRPDALLAALTGSGFNPRIISTTGQKTLELPQDMLSDPTTVGVIIYGTPNILDIESGMNAMSQFVLRNKHIHRDLNNIVKRRGRFSLAIGPMACQLLFDSRIISYKQGEGSVPKIVKNASGRYESRWLNFHIPRDTKAVALHDLKGCVLPCWAQGTHLGFGHADPNVFEEMEERGQIASLFHGQRVQDGSATKYPLNPSEGYSYAGLCSEDGRHLAILYDPCLAFHASQWQYVNTNSVENFVSPWKMMFYRLRLWSVAVRNGADVQSRNDLDPQHRFATAARQFPFNDLRGAIPAAGEQVPNMFIP
ncbi:tegument protein/v-FGAM-synthase [Porcine lymphotropic herpesvirus 2]|uniref:Tegument protein/v-FGAM-synthase n=2 Tax=Suid gammaherpesvirus 4 TaxID=1960250 RepID=Q772U6_9GAMA|nr:tegument protein/v-FGAM-synthase [Porcine lymphotropic herpesvirus 2]AAO12277.1 tegument protein/v-FGAM-synthase [Porcine lymphotropic herpesvirus 2]AAO12349.1 tegument protein/v-FGAM-synthase [Porcine lymphotropic herpesvirus 2]